jgi:hypothetical protein
VKRRVLILGADSATTRTRFQQLLDTLGVPVTAWKPLYAPIAGARYDLAIVCADPSPDVMDYGDRKVFRDWMDQIVKPHCGQVLVLAELRSSLWGAEA